MSDIKYLTTNQIGFLTLGLTREFSSLGCVLFKTSHNEVVLMVDVFCVVSENEDNHICHYEVISN
jgi:hypothetical protein